MPVTNSSRASPGQNKTSSVGHGLWQRTRRAVSGGMAVVCRSRARLAVLGMAAHGGTVGNGTLEVGSSGRAVAEALGRELSAMEGLMSASQATAFPSE